MNTEYRISNYVDIVGHILNMAIIGGWSGMNIWTVLS